MERFTYYDGGEKEFVVMNECRNCHPGGENEQCGTCEYQSSANVQLARYEDINPDPTDLAADLAELKHYRELKAMGRLVELPCKVGDRLYRVYTDELGTDKEIGIYDIANIVIYPDGDVEFKYDAYDGCICDMDSLINNKPYLGYHLVFLTHEAAEQALERSTT